MKIFNITEGKFKSIIKKGLSLDVLYILCLIKEGVDIHSSFSEPRISSLISTLERKGYVHEGKLTESGEELYNSLLAEEEEVKTVRMQNREYEWEKFLSYYPPNNKFRWKGRLFMGDRGIKNNTQKGKDFFTQIVNAGIDAELLWKAVIVEALAKMEESYKTGENKMKYFINTESYLRQQRYMNFIEDAKELTEEEINAYKEAYNRNKKKPIENKKSIDI